MYKFWLVLIITFFLIRYVLPVVMRLVLGSFVRKQMRNGGFGVPPPRARARRPPGPPPAPGQVRVDYVPPAATEGSQFEGGEYVDFEEVREPKK